MVEEDSRLLTGRGSWASCLCVMACCLTWPLGIAHSHAQQPRGQWADLSNLFHRRRPHGCRWLVPLQQGCTGGACISCGCRGLTGLIAVVHSGWRPLLLAPVRHPSRTIGLQWHLLAKGRPEAASAGDRGRCSRLAIISLGGAEGRPAAAVGRPCSSMLACTWSAAVAAGHGW